MFNIQKTKGKDKGRHFQAETKRVDCHRPSLNELLQDLLPGEGNKTHIVVNVLNATELFSLKWLT